MGFPAAQHVRHRHSWHTRVIVTPLPPSTSARVILALMPFLPFKAPKRGIELSAPCLINIFNTVTFTSRHFFHPIWEITDSVISRVVSSCHIAPDRVSFLFPADSQTRLRVLGVISNRGLIICMMLHLTSHAAYFNEMTKNTWKIALPGCPISTATLR